MRQRLLAVATTCAILLGLAAPAHAADTTPPTAPGTPVASNLTEGSVTLTWTPSNDDVAVANYEVWHIYTDIVLRVGTPTANTFTVNTLRRGSVNRFYVVAFDTSGNRSPVSPTIVVTTLPGDLEPPGPVIGLTVSEITDTSARLTWFGVFWGDVDVFRVFRSLPTGGGATLIATVPFAGPRTIVVSGLFPGTQYRLGVSARDAAGNENSPSFLTVTTTGTPAPTCTVAYRVTSRWDNGFVAEVRITNTGATPVTGWSLAWLFANGQQIGNLWNGAPSQSGGNVTVTNLPHNATLSAGGGSQSFGFLGTSGAVNNDPSGFTLNGQGCQVA
jgi:chitodextrinase